MLCQFCDERISGFYVLKLINIIMNKNLVMTHDKENKREDQIDKITRRVLMFKTIKKIHSIIDKEKQQHKSDKMHVLFILGALVLSLILTYIVISVLDSMKVFVM